MNGTRPRSGRGADEPRVVEPAPRVAVDPVREAEPEHDDEEEREVARDLERRRVEHRATRTPTRAVHRSESSPRRCSDCGNTTGVGRASPVVASMSRVGADDRAASVHLRSIARTRTASSSSPGASRSRALPSVGDQVASERPAVHVVRAVEFGGGEHVSSSSAGLNRRDEPATVARCSGGSEPPSPQRSRCSCSLRCPRSASTRREVRHPGRRVAHVRARDARPARDDAAGPRRRRRPLHAPLGPGRAGKPATPRDPPTRRIDWGAYGDVLDALHAHGIPALVTLYGSPRWANGGRAPNRAADVAASATSRTPRRRRFPWVRMWTVWNEPNTPHLLGAGVAAALRHAACSTRPTPRCTRRARANLVAGGVTSPRKTPTRHGAARVHAGHARRARAARRVRAEPVSRSAAARRRRARRARRAATSRWRRCPRSAPT